MKLFKLCLIFTIIMSICITAFALDISVSEISINEAVEFTYEVDSGVRVAKILNVKGVLSHQMSEAVAGAMRKDGVLYDSVQTNSNDKGEFTLQFVLSEDLVSETFEISASTPNSKEPATINIKVSGLGTEADLKSFSVNGSTGSADEKNVISIKPSNTYDVSAVVPVFITSSDAVVYVDGVKQISGESIVDFSNGAVTYKVVSENLAKTKYYKVSVKASGSEGGNGGGSGGGGGGASTAVTVPVVTDKVDFTQSQDNKTDSIFNDMENVQWAVPYVNRLYSLRIVSGDGSGKFLPLNNVTREEFVKMIVSASGITKKNGISFTDVSHDKWYAPYVDIAFSNGIITGISETEFGTGRYITRQEMAVIALRTMNVLGKNTTVNTDGTMFADDSAIADYAKQAVYTLKEIGILSGVGENIFDPAGKTQRCAAAKVICMIIDREGN